MKIIYNAPKGHRHKKGSIKVKGVGRVPVFQYLTCAKYWWDYVNNKWISTTNHEYDNYVSVYCHTVTNIKQMIRHIKKHSKYLPKGTKFFLVSKHNKIKDVIVII